jgi:hypothetical protein
MKVPKRLYKYVPFDARSLQNLKSQMIYFGAPASFNDPYDCAITPHVPYPTKSEVRKWQQISDQKADLTPELLEWAKRTSLSQIREVMHKTVAKRLPATLNEFIKKRGVACFSETPDNLIMWSHYGGRYKGLCLEFDTSFDPLTKAKPVEYVERPPEISVSSVLGLDNAGMDSERDQIERLFRMKSTSWRYEREWRVMHQAAGTAYVYQAPALTGIYFGPDIDFPSVEIVCLIMEGQNREVSLYSGSRSSQDFKVDFHKFTYTDFLTAEKNGMRREGESDLVWPIRPPKRVSYRFKSAPLVRSR